MKILFRFAKLMAGLAVLLLLVFQPLGILESLCADICQISGHIDGLKIVASFKCAVAYLGNAVGYAYLGKRIDVGKTIHT